MGKGAQLEEAMPSEQNDGTTQAKPATPALDRARYLICIDLECTCDGNHGIVHESAVPREDMEVRRVGDFHCQRRAIARAWRCSLSWPGAVTRVIACWYLLLHGGARNGKEPLPAPSPACIVLSYLHTARTFFRSFAHLQNSRCAPRYPPVRHTSRAPPPTPRARRQVIEFPWVCVDTRTNEITAMEQVFVRPEYSPITPFCTELTGIDEATVASAGTLADAVHQLSAFVEPLLAEAGPNGVCMVTHGPWDLWVQLRGEAARKGIELPRVLSRFYDLKVRREIRCHRSMRSSLRLEASTTSRPRSLVGRARAARPRPRQ